MKYMKRLYNGMFVLNMFELGYHNKVSASLFIHFPYERK